MDKIESYNRIALNDFPGLYVYALYASGSNALEVGLAHESRNKLQCKHVTGLMVHERDVDDIIEQLSGGSIMALKTGALAAHVYDEEVLHLPIGLNPVLIELLAKTAEEAFGGVFGEDVAASVDLSDWEFLWLFYDRGTQRLKFGLGVYKPDGTRFPGETCYGLPRREVERFAAEMFTDLTPLPMPARAQTTEAPAARAYLDPDDKKTLAVELVRLFDKTKRHGE